MIFLWDCLNCERTVELDTHGRCEHCSSDAVAAHDAPRTLAVKVKKKRVSKKQRDLIELERLFK
jgi:hypothetical protein